jgi:ABC-type multidrug transport system fused ATPase/permease subunit
MLYFVDGFFATKLTAVAVTHELKNIKGYGEIVVLESGKIVEEENRGS